MPKVKLVNGKLPKGRKCLIRLTDFSKNSSGITNRWRLEYNPEGDISVWFYHYNGRVWYEVLTNLGRDKSTVKINPYFKNWKNPTKSEVNYFKMVTGLLYLTDYLKLEPLDD